MLLNGYWAKTLDGQDAFIQSDGWVFYGRQQQWYYEPNLLTMPAAPAFTRISAKADRERKRLKTGWPSLREAWSLKTTRVRGIADVLRLLVLCAPLYILVHLPIYINRFRLPAGDETGYGNHEVACAIGLCVLALFALTWIYLEHLIVVDPHKAALVLGTMAGALAVSAVSRRVRAFDQAMDKINHHRG